MTIKKRIGILGAAFAVIISTSAASCKQMQDWSNSGTYPLDMRNEYKEFNPETKDLEWVKRQWRMEIPRAYVMDVSGRNGVPRNSGTSDFDNPFRMSLSTQIDPETMTLMPNPYKGQAGHMSHRLDIHLRNSRPAKVIRNAEGSETFCYNNAQLAQLSGTNTSSPVYQCRSTRKLCDVTMFVGGWSVPMSISRDFYDNPQPYCDAAREFLDGMTLRRDDQTATFESIKRDYDAKINLGSE